MSFVAYLVTWQLFAAGGALAAVPILIHLLSRRRVRHVRWAAMTWLLAAMKRHQRRMKLENWLILALRVAAILLLGLALARPVLTDSPLAPLLGNKRSVYLVLDNSYSTEAKLDARSVFDRVKLEADLVLKSIAPGDAAAVVVTNDPDEDATNGLEPHVLLGRSVGNEGAAAARESVAALRTRHAAANWAKALDAIQAQMSDEDPNRTVIVVTDLQAKDWLSRPRERITDTDMVAVDGQEEGRVRKRLLALLRRPAKVRIIDVGGSNRRDLAVVDIENRTEQDPFVGRPLRLAVTVANHGAVAVSGAQLEVRVDEGERKRIFPVPDLAAADTGLRVPKPVLETVQVDLPRGTFDTPGSHTIEVTVVPPRTDPAADALGLSSERRLALEVRRRVNVLAWSQTSRTEDSSMDAELYLRGIYEGDAPEGASTTLGPGLPPIYHYRSATSENDLLVRLQGRARDPVDLVVLANVRPRDEALAAALRAFVREGGGLLVFTGDRTDAETLNLAFHPEAPAQRLLPFAFERAEVRTRDDPTAGSFQLDFSFQEDPHPLAEPFTNVKADDWIKRVPPRIWGRTPFDVPAPVPGPSDGSDATGSRTSVEDRVVLRFTDGKPAVVAGRFGEGRTIWVGTSIDNGWLATSVLFLPVFLEEAAMFITRPAEAGRNLEVGGTLRATVPAEAEQVRIVPPGGGATSPARRTPEGADTARVEYEHTTVGRAGIWRLTYEIPSITGEKERVVEAFAVNPDPAEGALLEAAQSAIRDGIPGELDLGFLPSFGDVSSELEEAREGEITHHLLYAVLAILLLESLLAMRFGRRARPLETETT